MRILLDTNIVVSALLWQGVPHHLLAAIQRQPGVQLFSSSALLEELAEVLVPGDPDDDQVIAAAVAARVDFIVSGDRRHLLPHGSHQGIAIVEAAEALRRLAARMA